MPSGKQSFAVETVGSYIYLALINEPTITIKVYNVSDINKNNEGTWLAFQSNHYTYDNNNNFNGNTQ